MHVNQNSLWTIPSEMLPNHGVVGLLHERGMRIQ